MTLLPAKTARDPWVAHVAVSFMPWVNLKVFCALAIAMRLGLGHWPVPMIDEPDIPFGRQFMDVSAGSVWLTLLGVPVWLAWMGYRVWLGAGQQTGIALLVFSSGWLVSVLVTYIDPFGFVSWWLD